MPDDAEQIRASVVSRYGRLAEAAAAGQVTDCGPGETCFGGRRLRRHGSTFPKALRASLGCGNPVVVAALNPGETVLDLGSGGGIDVLLSARRVGPSGLGLRTGRITRDDQPGPRERRRRGRAER